MITLCWVLLSVGQEPARRPVPDAAAQKEAEKLIREVFKDDFAKKAPADKVALATKLIEQGAGSTEDAAKFVLLREARDLAAGAGDPTVAFQALDALTKAFQVDAIKLRSSTLTAVAANAKTPEEISGLARSYLKVADDAVSAEDFDEALKAVDLAAAQAKRSKDVGLASKAAARKKEMFELRDRSRSVQKARDTLEKSPDDAAANFAVGQYECLVKGDWATGLPRMARGAGPLRALAERDLVSPTDAGEKASIGDGYLEASEKETGIVRENLRARALHWYESALAGLAGLNKAKVEKRIPELRLERFKGIWIEVTDPKAFGLEGAVGAPFVLTPPPNGYKDAPLMKPPPGDFDGVSVRIRAGETSDANALLHYERNKRSFLVDHKDIEVRRLRMESKWVREWYARVEKRTAYMFTILIESGEYVFYVDGKEVTREKTPFTRLISLSLQADYGPVTFDQFKLRKKE